MSLNTYALHGPDDDERDVVVVLQNDEYQNKNGKEYAIDLFIKEN